MSEIENAIKFFGSQSAMAKALGVKAPTVSEWVSGQRPVPPLRAFQIESLSKGAISAIALNEKCRAITFSPLPQEAA